MRKRESKRFEREGERRARWALLIRIIVELTTGINNIFIRLIKISYLQLKILIIMLTVRKKRQLRRGLGLDASWLFSSVQQFSFKYVDPKFS